MEAEDPDVDCLGSLTEFEISMPVDSVSNNAGLAFRYKTNRPPGPRYAFLLQIDYSNASKSQPRRRKLHRSSPNMDGKIISNLILMPMIPQIPR